MNTKARILVVDDDRELLETIADILKIKGYKVTMANSGEEAIQRAKVGQYDVALMDIEMPGINGLEAFKKIKALRSRLKVILMTGYPGGELITQARREGPLDILFKPIDMRRLMRLIEADSQHCAILVVDDDPAICQTMKDIFEEFGHKVLVAGTGELAIDLVKKINPHILFLDVKLSTMNGLDTFKAIKELNHEVAVVMMTAHKRENGSLVEAALAQGAYSCLYKPFAPEEAIAMVDLLHQRSRGFAT
ncbi:MAG: response regulator [Chloroflexi bacterium]|nr:response regulator [Chloroflexota bacterium]